MDYKSIIVQWMEFKPPKTLTREQTINIEMDFISTITGSRRSGKTYFCFQLINSLLKQGIPRSNILYINFEDNRLIGAEAKDLDELLNAFYELSETDSKKRIYLFLDEIQVVKNWDAWARKIYDTKKNIKLILTGSSSKLLSKDISTKLRGRTINTEIYPLSFREFLQWKNISYNMKTLPYSESRFEIKKQFSAFLSEGGYPAVLTSKSQHKTILKNYFESMIFKDIVERYNISDIKRLKVLAGLLFESTAKEMSYTKTANKLKSKGFSISKNTLIEYIAHFEDAYLFFQSMKYEYSLTKQLGSIKKLYCIDNGLLNAVSFRFSENKGKLLENLIFIELKRRGKEIYYHRKNNECDFLIKEKNRIISAIQVCGELTEENEKREINGLLEAMSAHNLNEGLIITLDKQEARHVNGKKITILPAWIWLLEN
ncbi:MAG: ATP-binding protein [Candidatus Woesearchaeota archaeon]